MAGVIRIRCHLPAAEVDRLQPGLHLLYRLVAGEGAEGRHILFVVQQPPQPLRAQARQRVFDLEGAT